MVGYLNGATFLTDKNFHFGGTNLITGSSSFDGFEMNGLSLQNTYDMFGNKQVLINQTWVSPTKSFNVFAGQIICFSVVIQAIDSQNPPILGAYAGDRRYSATAKVDNDNKTTNNLIYIDDDSSYIDDANNAQAFQPKDTNQHIMYGFFKITSSGTLVPRIESQNTNSWLVSSFKAEIGTIKTNWSPAPQDMATKSDITSLQDQINQLKNQIKS